MEEPLASDFFLLLFFWKKTVSIIVGSFDWYVDLRYCSSLHTLNLGVEHSFHCIDKELLRLHKNFFVNKLKKGTQEEDSFCLLPALGEPGQDDVNVANIRWSSLVWQKLKVFPSCPLTGSSHLVARAKDMLNIMDKIFSSACLIVLSLCTVVHGCARLYKAVHGTILYNGE